MKLYDKLLRENKVKLAADSDNYPDTINELLVTLNTKKFWTDLTIHEATDLLAMLNAGSLSITELDNLFKK